MRRLRALPTLLACFAVASVGIARAQATTSKEVLVLTTPTLIPRSANTFGLELQNLGPLPIYCALGASTNAVVNKAHKLDAYGGSWVVDAKATVKVWCVTTVNQVTGAATVADELTQ